MKYIKLPIECKSSANQDVDYEALGIEEPEDTNEYRESVVFIEKITGFVPTPSTGGTLLYLIDGDSLHTTLSIKEVFELKIREVWG